MTPLIIDNFAGGGGASTGIEAALGRAVDIAINHDEQAIRMHAVNHPGTRHIRNNIWRIDPQEVCEGRPVRLAWFSPDCKHFSKAKGGKPREKSIRDLAWIVVLWAQRVKPDVILLENVEEFRTWGPLCDEGRPIRERAGETFDKWQRALRREGYKLQFRELRACDYGAPTIRKRFFMIARRDGNPIVWPEPTHRPPGDAEFTAWRTRQRKLGFKVPSANLPHWRTAADIIDWSIPCPSIFERKKPLAENTLRRIAHGIMKFVVDNPRPFIVATDFKNTRASRVFDIEDPLRTQTAQPATAVIVPTIVGCGGRRGQSGPTDVERPYPTTTAKADSCLVSAHLVQTGYGEREGQAPRAIDAQKPLGTAVAGGVKHAVATARLMAAHFEQANGGPRNENLAGRPADAPLSTAATTGSQQRVVTSNLVKLRGTCAHGQRTDEPLHTVSAGGTHMAEVRAFLIKYYGGTSSDEGHGLDSPLGTVTVQDRFGLVTVTIEGEEYVIVDIGMRMLTPRELFNAQGFPPDYVIDRDSNGDPITKTAQVAKCGNSVCPPIAEALVRAQFAETAADRKSDGVAA
ncbi:DNA cytosine methyltransferase [Stakelama tenebrarum]|uniref:DNA (cytosine-5-)-methyltransferase n=1 Tax=Stakelama tenebrarum TaxID=2711215 RepID=A0A6G6Y4S5_9SPHN|nr:DNA cytosine methyltransferase [Sphingosinithalassobacter tenebrarum]QIG79954.1 DNA cytosine methyltransferase [Sphingosinithalassobacter tenebrarum]